MPFSHSSPNSRAQATASGRFFTPNFVKIRLVYRYQNCEDWPNPLVLIGAIKESVWENQYCYQAG